MNKKIVLASLAFLGFLLLASFKENEATVALQKTTQAFHAQLDKTAAAIAGIKLAVQKLDGSTASAVGLQDAVTNARMAFKKAEFLLAYIDGYAIKKNINGAPLPTVDPAIIDVMVIEPSGLQVLDEIAFGDDPAAEKATLLALCDKLVQDFSDVKMHQSKVELTHRHVLEAVRQELVRVFTLGVTGFDTPGSANAIPEAATALAGAYDAFKNYMPLLAEKDRGLAILLDARMEHTLNYLTENGDFENFDRLTFLMEHIEPQYQLFYEAHKALGVEFAEETDKLPRAVNYHATSLFAPDFLSAGYYANLDLKHPLMEKRKELGRTLFFDPVLSKNLERSCASCHLPEKAFTDGQPKSIATGRNGTLLRNSPTLVNAVYAENFFWDLREPRLDRQMLHVIKEASEFGTDYPEIIEKLSQSSEYRQLFAAAYPEMPDYQLSTYSISDALSAYVASLTDFDSPFDQYVQGKTGVMDPAVRRGFNLFMGKAACGTCHFAPVFNGTVPPAYNETESEVLGITAMPDTLHPSLDTDLGKYANGMPRSKAAFYKTSFKTVTVRNAELTAPYMHNGVFKTLEEVVDFYNRGGGQGLQLDVPHQTLPFDELKLSKAEQADLVAFMKSLTGNMSKFTAPERLPAFEGKADWNARKIGGVY